MCPPLLARRRLYKFQKLGDDGGDLTIWQKLFVFFRTPLVKYVEHCISYIIFLLIYTYFLLFEFEWRMQKSEIVVYVWFATLMVDELREFLIQPGSRLARKFNDYIDSVWNKFDLFIFLFAILSMTLKQFAVTFQAARVLFACNSALLYIRLFRVYHANWSLGPKLIIFHRMLPELFIFMMLLSIFILGYGTASQALIHPSRSFDWSSVPSLVEGILFLPYWQMYGEISLDKIETGNVTLKLNISKIYKCFQILCKTWFKVVHKNPCMGLNTDISFIVTFDIWDIS